MGLDSKQYQRRLARCMGCEMARREGAGMVCAETGMAVREMANEACPLGRAEVTVQGECRSIGRTIGGAAGMVGRGVVGLVKALVGADRASDGVIEARLAVCEKCEVASAGGRLCGHPLLVAAGKGRGCGCVIEAKARIAGEKCPAGKW